MTSERHLHRDYNSAWCGIDASHVLMTHEPSEATCSICTEARATELRHQSSLEEMRAKLEAENAAHTACVSDQVAELRRRSEARATQLKQMRVHK